MCGRECWLAGGCVHSVYWMLLIIVTVCAYLQYWMSVKFTYRSFLSDYYNQHFHCFTVDAIMKQWKCQSYRLHVWLDSWVVCYIGWAWIRNLKRTESYIGLLWISYCFHAKYSSNSCWAVLQCLVKVILISRKEVACNLNGMTKCEWLFNYLSAYASGSHIMFSIVAMVFIGVTMVSCCVALWTIEPCWCYGEEVFQWWGLHYYPGWFHKYVFWQVMILYIQGDSADTFYLVESGKVTITKEDPVSHHSTL